MMHFFEKLFVRYLTARGYLFINPKAFSVILNNMCNELISVQAQIDGFIKAQSLSPLLNRKLIKRFSPAELKVASILVEGFEDKEIAAKLGKSIYTINQHIRNMREKAGCRNTKELIAYLLRNDIV
ncbi:MAG: helix-turn-helix transcriptional regulator [Ignavibacteria bacterium]|nr:helix-turn-helix transcriptional regulator [Ignavibacteria bacterium]